MRPFVRRLITAALVTSALTAAGIAALVPLVGSVPLPNDLGVAPTVVRAADGTELGTLQPERAREVRLAELPPSLPQAVLAAEDAGFYRHPGVSIAGTARAAIVNLTSGRVRQGGSTISQQYVKNAVLQDPSRTALRKVREAVLALKLERLYPKDRILEFYLNSIYLGRGAYGVQAAAEAYFGKPAGDLAPAESILLAALIPAPSATDPLTAPDRAAARYGHVVDRLAAEGWIDSVQAAQLRADGVPPVLPRRPIASGNAPFFLRMVADELEAVVGGDEPPAGLDVTTTLDPRLQAVAEATYAEQFAAVEGPTGALVALSPVTGGISALVGGRDYATDQVNLALASRQPGSTFKTFALAAWIEQGGSAETRFDAPATYTVADADYTVTNFGGARQRRASLRQATWSSVNTVYAQVAEQVGFDRVAEVAVRAGIHQGVRPFPSVVLGAEEVTPLELAEAYNTFAAGGIHREPFTIAEVRRAGDVVFARRPFEHRAFDPGVAAVVTDVLRGVIVRGTGRAAAVLVPAAGKTGTTDDHGDAWFAGYTPSLTAVVWMGNRDDRARMPGDPTGGDLPAALWGAFVARAYAEVLSAPGDFPPPPRAEPTPAPAGTPAPSAVPAPTRSPASTPSARAPSPTPAPILPSPPAAPPAPLVTTSPSPEPTPAPTPSPSGELETEEAEPELSPDHDSVGTP